ncbi:16S rRNA (cytosine(1402)-N(4))-methyltransferase RsmH [Candidatus Parcubacteria bacterium]|mgnify:CR=1 FL=1|jgi:16S rRNA (cytosine1402-N4)-methyltransferase|nr:16S rRNA (cytosine(1402)-N(4))-methyltransferase RsmH [Candidatus Parcubacteria bacterium]
MESDYQHISVLADEIVEYLQPKKNQHFIDCTLGGGGHTGLILNKTAPKGKVLAFELDARARKAAKANLKQYNDRLIIVAKSYAHLQEQYGKHKKDLPQISGILMDLGLSSDQLDRANRGFSFKDDGPLDMRFDTKNQTLTASEIILEWPEDKLIKVFQEYGEVVSSRRLAKGLVSWRKTLPKQKQKAIKSSMLVGTILRILKISPTSLGRFRTHPATRIFQALRIAVNSELENLTKVLPQTLDILAPGGRLAVISFHSLEDRIVKHYFKNLNRGCICPPESPVCNCDTKPVVKIITKKVIKPTQKEITKNRRSRSALLRVIEKI